jgi:hypothetical protein
MTFNISEFTSQINRIGIAKNNLFVVSINLPESLSYLNDKIAIRDLIFLCKDIKLPNLAVNALPYIPNTIGMVERRPVSMEYPILDAEFMVDSNFNVMKFFHRWIQGIINYDVSSGQYSTAPGTNTLPFEIEYKSNYVSTITVDVYSDNIDYYKYRYVFGNAYPINVGGITPSWQESAQVMSMPVGFSYDTLKVDGANSGNVSSNNLNRGIGLLQNLSNMNSASQLINLLNLPGNAQNAINDLTSLSFSRLTNLL